MGATVPTSTSWSNVPDSIDPGDSAADETSLTLTGLTNDTVHAFELRAVNLGGAGTKTSITATPTLASTLELESVTASFSTVTLACNQLLNTGSVPDKSHFTLSVGTVPERSNAKGVEPIRLRTASASRQIRLSRTWT